MLSGGLKKKERGRSVEWRVEDEGVEEDLGDHSVVWDLRV